MTIIGEKALIKSVARAYHIPNYNKLLKSLRDSGTSTNSYIFEEIAKRELAGVDLVDYIDSITVKAKDICEVVLVSSEQMHPIMTPTCIVKLDNDIYIALKIEDLIFIKPIDGVDFVYNNRGRFVYKYITYHYDVEYGVTSYSDIDGWSRECNGADLSYSKLQSSYTFLGRFECDFTRLPESATKFKDIRDVPFARMKWILDSAYFFYYKDVALTEVCSSCNIYVHHSESTKLRYNDITLCESCYESASLKCDICDAHKNPHAFRGRIFDDDYNSEYKNHLKLNNIENICDRCLSANSKTCDSCGKSDFIDISKLREKNKADKYIMYEILTDKFSRFNGITMCRKCYIIRIDKNSKLPIRGKISLIDIGEHTSKMVKVDRFISVESELITDYHDYEEARENVHVPRNWSICGDSSLTDGGVEYKTISPIRGDNIYNDLRALEKTYYNGDMNIDNTCGIHIHINALDFGFQEMKNLLLIYNSIDSTIFDSMPYSRRENSNCQPLNGVNTDIMVDIHNMRDLVDYWYRVIGKCEPDESHYNSSRYHGLNLHSKFYHGTIEFRYHEGEIEPEPIISWIEFCNSTMTLAREMATDKTDSKALKSLMLDSNVSGLEVISNMGRDNLNYIENRIKENN